MKSFIKRYLKFLYSFLPGNLKSFIRNTYINKSGIITVSNKGRKKALIIYLKQPFLFDNKVVMHCNVYESLIIKDELLNLDYAVDAIDYRYKYEIDYSKYDLIFGFGDLFSKSFTSKNIKNNLKRICYSTGTYIDTWNNAEVTRLQYFNNRFNSKLTPQRPWGWDISTFSFLNADGVIQTGNQWTESTFDHLSIKNFFVVPVPTITQENKSIPLEKMTGKDFIFFSGAGAVFKGLDLVIEAFNSINSNSNSNLYIYGPFDEEENFMSIFRPIIDKNPNIFFKGVIDPISDEFDQVVSSCAFTILPSCGESGASSVITTMHKGLIPIVTEGTSVDLFNFGISIESLTIDSVKESIEKALLLSDNEILRQRKLIVNHINSNHTQASYRSKLKDALKIILA